MEAKVIMGDDYVEKICDVNDARKEGLISGMRNFVKKVRKSILSLIVFINISKNINYSYLPY